MAPRLRRPEVDAAVHLCSRTLTGEQSAAIEVANHQRLQLVHPKSPETIPVWADELELDILIGFGIDPKRYKVRIHDLTPSDQPCPEEHELKSLKDHGLDEVISGPYEVHFVLRDGVAAPTTQALREWQQRWAVVAADPPPAPAKHMFTLCNSRNHFASLAVDNLKTPPEGDVGRTLRHGLGLTSTTDIVKHQLGKALRLDLTGRDVKFHLNGETCAALRDIEELTTITLAPDNMVKLHTSSASGVGSLAMGGGGETEDEETDED